jgi:hypothetical protein
MPLAGGFLEMTQRVQLGAFQLGLPPKAGRGFNNACIQVFDRRGHLPSSTDQAAQLHLFQAELHLSPLHHPFQGESKGFHQSNSAATR